MWPRLSVSSRSVRYEDFVKICFICSTYMDLAGQDSFCPGVLSASLSWEYSQAFSFVASMCSGSAVSALHDVSTW